MIPRLLIIWLVIALLFSLSLLPPAHPQIPNEPGGTTVHSGTPVGVRLGKAIDPLDDNVVGDYYVRAVGLLLDTANPHLPSEKNIDTVSIPGGLVFEGSPPYYESFSSHEIIPLPNWPQSATKLLGITTDGTKGFVNENHDDSDSFLIDFSTGALTSFPTTDPRPSPNGKWIILPGLSTGSAIMRNIDTGQEVPLCSPLSGPYRWSMDSTKLLSINGIDHVVFITDLNTGNCKLVKISGLDWNTEVLMRPDDQQFYIILPGSGQTGTDGWLMTANLDGSGATKKSDLPFYGREPNSVALVSPDGTSVYVDGYVVDVASGDYARTPARALAWLKASPPSGVVRSLQIDVNPSRGERGTRFRFSMAGGPIEQEITWYVSRTSDKKSPLVSSTLHLDQTGSLDDQQKEFGFDTGLPTDAGDYFILVYIGDKKIGSGSFSVIEP